MTSIRDLLAAHPFFDGLSAADVDLLAACGTDVRFARGSRVLSGGQPAASFYLLCSGRVALEISVAGREPLVIETLGAGEVLGVSWLFPPYRASFDATAMDDTSAVEMNAAALRRACDGDPRLGYAVMSRFSGLLRDRLQATRLQLLDVYRHGHGT
jgi:CRP-like cAMP-binding protein